MIPIFCDKKMLQMNNVFVFLLYHISQSFIHLDRADINYGKLNFCLSLTITIYTGIPFVKVD